MTTEAAPDYSQAVHPLPDGALIEVWVVPRARITELGGLHGDALKIRVAVAPEGGKANRALSEFLSSMLGANVRLVSGATARRKHFHVRGIPAAEVARRLGAAEATGG